MPHPASPCIGICRIDGRSRLCQGCLRSLSEIADWPMLNELQKQEILDRLPERRVPGQS